VRAAAVRGSAVVTLSSESFKWSSSSPEVDLFFQVGGVWLHPLWKTKGIEFAESGAGPRRVRDWCEWWWAGFRYRPSASIYRLSVQLHAAVVQTGRAWRLSVAGNADDLSCKPRSTVVRLRHRRMTGRPLALVHFCLLPRQYDKKRCAPEEMAILFSNKVEVLMICECLRKNIWELSKQAKIHVVDNYYPARPRRPTPLKRSPSVTGL
jgi:hypothetical protein